MAVGVLLRGCGSLVQVVCDALRCCKGLGSKPRKLSQGRYFPQFLAGGCMAEPHGQQSVDIIFHNSTIGSHGALGFV